ncbi:hypothetical protein N7510_010389 [Penicillium lagena]|uniref:uncharacterized protein n=1 Tax=Penicillium lagena TaxID=94218 RepID=UPI0025406708|nr:uncharacterized protein N7510_010389 [Penicillium lagena]KAJ5605235.1 hypothetical protein N7510_010389 [Penicillium lagena]
MKCLVQDGEALSAGAAPFTGHQCVDDCEDDAYHKAKADPAQGVVPGSCDSVMKHERFGKRVDEGVEWYELAGMDEDQEKEIGMGEREDGDDAGRVSPWVV